MLLKCQACNKVKKFGEWVEIPEALNEALKDCDVTTNTLCPHCQGNGVSMSSLEQAVVLKQTTNVVDTISLE